MPHARIGTRPQAAHRRRLPREGQDFEHKGRTVLASRLGYRITYDFATHFLGRIFDDPGIVFNEEILKPELQSLDDFVDGIENIVEAQKKVAL